MTTMRARMLALVRGERVDRVPFVQYAGMAPREEAWAVVGRDHLGLLKWVGACTQHSPNCRTDSVRLEVDGNPAVRHVLHTPKGTLEQIRLVEPVLGSTAAHRHYVRAPGDYEVLLSYLRDIRVSPNTDGIAAVRAELGDDGLPHAALVRTPFQQLWVQWVSAADLAWHMLEHADLVEACATEMGRILREMMDCVVDLDVPYINFPDNITAPMIGPEHFRRFCVPYYREMAARLGAAARDVPVFVHMDGDLKPLWREIADSGVRGLDSMSPPPDNDTSVADALREWPEMRVCINFPSSVHLRPPEAVYRATLEILEQGGHSGRLQIQISENLPPGRWRVSYPAIVDAIRDFYA